MERISKSDSGSSFGEEDYKYMKIALRLSEKGIGFTEPNPLVGAVLVKKHKIIASGFHQFYGGKHAEAIALNQTEEKDTTLYVTLEPCCHYGKTGPCTDLIIRKGVKRVVVCMTDPNPQVKGRGIQQLRKAGIEVCTGILREVAEKINRHYLHFTRKRIPYVTLKAGISIDGKLTDRSGRSQWVTDPQLRQMAHSLRGEFSAILVGANTVIEDNARLTLREKGWGKKVFHRIILDTENSLGPELNIFSDQKQFPLVIFSSRDASATETKTKNHFFVSARGQHLDLGEVLLHLAELGICSVLVEGGGEVLDSFLTEQLYNEIILFAAKKIIGGLDSVQLFASGTPLERPVLMREENIMEMDQGYIIRGFK